MSPLPLTSRCACRCCPYKTIQTTFKYICVTDTSLSTDLFLNVSGGYGSGRLDSRLKTFLSAQSFFALAGLANFAFDRRLRRPARKIKNDVSNRKGQIQSRMKARSPRNKQVLRGWRVSFRQTLCSHFNGLASLRSALVYPGAANQLYSITSA